MQSLHRSDFLEGISEFALADRALNFPHSQHTFDGVVGSFGAVVDAEDGTKPSFIKHHVHLTACVALAVDDTTRPHGDASGQNLFKAISNGLLHRVADKLRGGGLASVVERADEIVAYPPDEFSRVKRGFYGGSPLFVLGGCPYSNGT